MRHTVSIITALGLTVLVAMGAGLDSDGDGVPDDTDCRPGDASLWTAPGKPVTDLTLSLSGSAATLAWSTPNDPGGQAGTERYDTFGSFVPDAFGHLTGFCVELDDGVDLTATDDRTPRPGDVANYLVRVENDCGSGPIDTDPAPVAPRSLNFLVADNTNDSGPGSLREAIDLAVAGDAVCVNTSGTITLSSGLEIFKDVSIVGPGAGVLTIEPGGIALGENASISGVAVKGPVEGISVVYGSPTIASTRVTDFLRGISVRGATPRIVDSAIMNNEVGIWTRPSGFGRVTITTTTISGNDRGLLAFSYWGATISDSTFSGNAIGIDLTDFNSVTITSTTISGNNVGLSVYTNYEGYLTVKSSTISGNTIGIDTDFSYGILQNTILSNVTNCASSYGIPLEITSSGHNLSSDTTCPGLTETGDQENVDPLLGPLADNGGPTETQVPLPGSPVIDAGSCPGETRDQRGLPRPVDESGTPDADDACDIGAVEKQ